MQLEAGQPAPPFALEDQAARLVRSTDFAGRRLMVFFYPKANTSGCTAQACGLRDVVDQVGDTAIVGISPDAPDRQARFDAKYDLGFPLLADTDHAVAEAWGTWGQKSLYGKKYMGVIRSAFLVDPDGVIERAWYKVSPKDTPTELLAALAGR